MTEFGEILLLIAAAQEHPERARSPVGASADDLLRLRDELSFDLPPALIRWLSVCNGQLAGPGGLYGSLPQSDHLDIPTVLRPGWRERRWIPIAGDGCGDTYVLDAGRKHLPTDAVFFVDQSDYDALDYVVASDLPTFLRQHLRQELADPEDHRWPFDPEATLAVDPRLAEVRPESLLPWNA